MVEDQRQSAKRSARQADRRRGTKRKHGVGYGELLSSSGSSSSGVVKLRPVAKAKGAKDAPDAGVHNLRSGEQHSREVKNRGRRVYRDSAHFAYPSNYGDRSSVPSGSMSAAVSRGLNDRTALDPTSPASAKLVRSLFTADKTVLAPNKVSRNHILAGVSF
jgi:hypothetical protein